jgi:type II secretory pathway pseudopilin PulG
MYNVIKRQITLIEIMIVMFLIAMIIGVVAYNYQGSLDEGKAFKTKTSIEKIKTILTLAISDNPRLADDIDSHWKEIIKQSPMVQNAKDLQRDGWGDDYEVRYVDGHIYVVSKKFEDYKKKHPTSMFRDDSGEQ